MSISQKGAALVTAANAYGAAVAGKLTFTGQKDQVAFVKTSGVSMSLQAGDLLVLHRQVADDTALASAKAQADHYPIYDTRTGTAWYWSGVTWTSTPLASAAAFPRGRIYKDLVGLKSFFYDIDGTWYTLGAPGAL